MPYGRALYRGGVLWARRHLPLCRARVRARLCAHLHRRGGLQRKPGGVSRLLFVSRHEGNNDACMASQGLGGMELDNLRDWEAKFHYKYPVVGSLV